MFLLSTVNYHCTINYNYAAVNFLEEIIANICETPTDITGLWIITVSRHTRKLLNRD